MLDELPAEHREGSIENYRAKLASEWRPGSLLGKPRRVSIAGFPAIQVDLEGTMITDVVGYVGGGKITNYR